MTRLIDADELKDHKFAGNTFFQLGGRTNGKTLEAVNRAYQQGWNDAIDAITDNAPTIETTIEDLISTLSVEELKVTTRIKVDIPSGEAICFRREKTGHWIRTIIENGVTSAARCSECGFGDNRYMLFSYCPNCGADMREEEEK